MRVGGFLQKRGDLYRFRARLPAELVAVFHRKEVVIPLAASDRRTALPRARRLRASLDALTTRLSAPELSRARAEALARQRVEAARDSFKRNLDETGTAFFDAAEVERMGSDNSREMDCLLRFAFETEVAPQMKTDIRRGLAKGGSAAEDIDAAVATVGRALAPEVEPQSAAGDRLAKSLLRGFATLLDERVALLCGAASPTQTPAEASAAAPAAPEPAFLARWDEFSAAKVSEGDWDVDTAQNARSSRNLFAGLTSADLTVSQIDGETVLSFRNALLRLPKFYDKAAIFRDLPLRERIAKADKLDSAIKATTGAAETLTRRLTVKTADKHFMNLIECFHWLQKIRAIPKDRDCPFAGYIKKRKNLLAARDDRLPWPPELEETLFASPVYRGCQSLHRRSRPGETIWRDALFWVPLLGRTLGLREDEICSARVGQVTFETRLQYPPGESGPEGLWCFTVIVGKTPASSRTLPLPKLLLDLGFLEYRLHGRKPGDALFPELIPQGLSARRSAAFTGRFTEYRRNLGALRARIDFHSFRANLATDINNLANVNAGWLDEITGHESGVRQSMRALYTKGVRLANLQRSSIACDFRGDEHLPRYLGPKGVPAPDAADEIKRFVALAQREMEKKASRRSNQAKQEHQT